MLVGVYSIENCIACWYSISYKSSDWNFLTQWITYILDRQVMAEICANLVVIGFWSRRTVVWWDSSVLREYRCSLSQLLKICLVQDLQLLEAGVSEDRQGVSVIDAVSQSPVWSWTVANIKRGMESFYLVKCTRVAIIFILTYPYKNLNHLFVNISIVYWNNNNHIKRVALRLMMCVCVFNREVSSYISWIMPLCFGK